MGAQLASRVAKCGRQNGETRQEEVSGCGGKASGSSWASRRRLARDSQRETEDRDGR